MHSLPLPLTTLFKKKVLFFFFLIYFWLGLVFIAVQGRSLVVAGERYALAVVLGLLIAAASLVAERQLSGTWVSVLSSQAR